MYFSERFFYGATSGLVALIVGKAGRENDRAVDGSDHFENRDLVRVAGKLVAAIGSLNAYQKAALAELLEDF